MHCTVRTVGKMCLVLMPGRTRAVSLREEYGFKLPLMTGTKQDYLGAVRPTQRAAGEGPRAHVPRRPGRFQRGISAAKYSTITGASPATTRDLADLVAKGALVALDRKSTRL